ncbi:DUF2339 domain-containing protein [Xanthomonas maliensis]|uniref:DUF2339 domain-containing protein n=1 Tax=Xanthomonas maliensis TaxID=1321368 RepID=UPI003CCD2AA9
MGAIIAVVVLGLAVVVAALVVALGKIGRLERRLQLAEQWIAQTQSNDVVRTGPPAASTPMPPPAVQPPPLPAETMVAVGARATPAALPPEPQVQGVASATTRAAGASAPPTATAAGRWARGIAGVKRWLTEGNVPVKVGMLVLLAGVAALLKYASDQGWLRVPIALRLVGIGLLAIGALAFGWRQRLTRPGFALAVQGGAIGVLLLTVFAAFKVYGLLQPAPALAISVLLIAGLCALAVLQNSRTLAVLGVLAGFMAPIWLSTGNANHVALFTYYALLNGGIVAIAWVRPWRVLNLLGFAFTFGIGTVWGVLDYAPAKFASTEPFLLLFFAMYLVIPILHARRGDGGTSRVVDGSLVFGTPLLAFALQAALLEWERTPLALYALALAALYAGLAAWLQRSASSRLLGQAHAALAVGFATLSVPLALSARVTASVFALEGAGLLWLGLRQRRALPQIAGMTLQALAAIAVAFGVDAWRDDRLAIANPTCMSMLLVALAGLVSAGTLHAAGRRGTALAAYLWGIGWWTLCALHEILRFANPQDAPDLVLAWLALSTGVVAAAHRRRPAAALRWTVAATFALSTLVAMWQTSVHAQPFAAWGWAAWLALALLGVLALRVLASDRSSGAAAAQLAWWLMWPCVVSLATFWLSERLVLGSGWRSALQMLPWLAVAAVGVLRWRWLAWPQPQNAALVRQALLALLFAMLGQGWVALLVDPADAAPLPWLPLLNPGELVQIATLALLARWVWSLGLPAAFQRAAAIALGVCAWGVATSSTLHGVHHWGQVPWTLALASTQLAQTSLAVVWSILGVVAWVTGSRRGQRVLWGAGALLMALVLAKLVLIDRQHLGNLLGIGSFIAYGLLCTVVGYLAPAPPRLASAEANVDARRAP